MRPADRPTDHQPLCSLSFLSAVAERTNDRRRGAAPDRPPPSSVASAFVSKRGKIVRAGWIERGRERERERAYDGRTDFHRTDGRTDGRRALATFSLPDADGRDSRTHEREREEREGETTRRRRRRRRPRRRASERPVISVQLWYTTLAKL